MKRLAFSMAAAAAAILLMPAAHAQPAPATPEIQQQIQQISSRLHPVRGDVRIDAANVVLHLGEDYYFLPPAEARLVLVDAWGNPPESAQSILGMVFPAGQTFADDTWGAVITYEASGYVRDDDAQSADYDELLTQLREGEDAVNQERARRGYPTQHLVGWAQAPTYDRRTHSVIWAQNVQFQGSRENTLNYDIRLLGRRGVLSLNMVTQMSKLAETRAAAERFTATAEFVPGSRYADYQEGNDAVAAYGVTGLIAAGLGVTLAQKAGLFAILLAFAKKGFILILAAIALIGGWLRRRFGTGQEEEPGAYPEPDYEAADALLAAQQAREPAADGPAPERSG
jgi:uncharacterized membrane-anchored protein